MAQKTAASTQDPAQDPVPVQKTAQFGIAETFGVDVPAGLKIEGFTNEIHPYIPRKNPDYVFRKETLRDILAFLSAPHGGGLYLTGPTGAGKTSAVTQIAARLNWPVQETTCHGRMELNDLIGHYTLDKDGGMQFVYGPLSVAVRDGHLMVLNESDLADPSELAGLNGVLDGMPLVIPEHEGEVIVPHPKFRLIATGNSAGQGDSTGLYQGVLRQNVAFLDRFRVVTIDYPEPELEVTLLGKVAPYLQTEIAQAMVRVAGEIRQLFLGKNGQQQQITTTMSTRGLVMWALLAGSFKTAPNPLAYAFKQIILNKMEPAEHEAVFQIARAVFGDAWEK
ncbi:MAG: AAA family ATPase [Acidiferrobacterales bacterium]